MYASTLYLECEIVAANSNTFKVQKLYDPMISGNTAIVKKTRIPQFNILFAYFPQRHEH